MIQQDLLYQHIFDVFKSEDDDLKSICNKGVFFAPELYLAFKAGKELKTNDQAIFGQNIEWKRELMIQENGPFDLIIIGDDGATSIFEIKLRSSLHDYQDDINKLMRIGQSYSRYFIALVDSWTDRYGNDPRILGLEAEFPENLVRLSTFRSFSTEQDRYQKPVSCTVAAWEVN